MDPDNFHFLRFNSVSLAYKYGSQSIDEKLHLFQDQFQLFKTAFSDLGEITLSATINQNDQSKFRNHSQLLDHIRKHLLPIFDSSLFYSLRIDINNNGTADDDGTADFIAQVLQMRPIIRCRDVYVLYKNEASIQVPVSHLKLATS